MAGKKKDSGLGDAVLRGLTDVPEDAVQLTGYLGKTNGALRLYPTLDDRSEYVEFAEADVVAVVGHDPTPRVTISLKADARVRSVRGEVVTEARFLAGAIGAKGGGPVVEDPGGIVSVDIDCGCPGTTSKV